jgi:hypothetical protein
MGLAKPSLRRRPCRDRSCSHLRATATLMTSVAIAGTGSTAGIVIASLASHPTIAGASKVTLWDQGTAYGHSAVETETYQYQTYTFDHDGGYTLTYTESWQAVDGAHYQNYKENITTSGTYVHYDLLNADYWSGTVEVDNTGMQDYDDLSGVPGTARNSTVNTLEWAGDSSSSGCGTFLEGGWLYTGIQTPCDQSAWSSSGWTYVHPEVWMSNGVKSTNEGAWISGSANVTVHVITRLQ